VPKDYDVCELIGEGEAKVTVGLDIANKDYGCGVSAFVSVTLTCDQDEAIIKMAGDAAVQMAAEIMPGAILEADVLYSEEWP